MAIAMIFDVPEMTQAVYDRVRAEVLPDNRSAAGMRYHVAGPSGRRRVKVWESQEAADRFFQAPLGPALRRANTSVQPQVFPVHNTMQP